MYVFFLSLMKDRCCGWLTKYVFRLFSILLSVRTVEDKYNGCLWISDFHFFLKLGSTIWIINNILWFLDFTRGLPFARNPNLSPWILDSFSGFQISNS